MGMHQEIVCPCGDSLIPGSIATEEYVAAWKAERASRKAALEDERKQRKEERAKQRAALGAELEKHLGVFGVALQLLERLHGLLERRALARDGLRLLGVVPEAGDEGALAELLDLPLQPRDVKDAPLAP